MDIMEFLKTRRTYRRFEQKPVEPAIAREIMEAARIASCGANRQTLKYVLVQSPEMVAKNAAAGALGCLPAAGAGPAQTG